MMVSNGLSNGHSNGHSDQEYTRTLKTLILELCNEVTTVKGVISLKSGESATPYLRAVENAIVTFVQSAGQMLAEAESKVEKIHAQQQGAARSHLDRINKALQDVNYTGSFNYFKPGQKLSRVASEYVEDLFSSHKRSETVSASTETLEAIMRFLLLCDHLDVFFIIEAIDVAKEVLRSLREAKDVAEVEERYNMLMNVLQEIDESTTLRLAELTCHEEREDLLALRTLLKNSRPIVYSTTKATVVHPENAAACDAAHMDLRRALEGIRGVLRGDKIDGSFASSSLKGYGTLAANLEHFQNRVMMDPAQYRPQKDRQELEALLENIVTDSAGIADENSTRNNRKHAIIVECNNLRQALQDLLTEYEKNRGRPEASEDLDLAMVLVQRRQKDLKRHLRRAIVDNVGDAFLDQATPLLVLIESASRGDHGATKNAASGFEVHAKRLIHVARLACEMSTDADGMRHVKYISEHVERLLPQVVQAALLLCSNPTSPVAVENMEELRKMWESRVHGLTLAVDALLSLDDFLPVTETHIVEDATIGLRAIHENESHTLDSKAGAIRGRSLRVCDVVEEEMACLEGSGHYAENVKLATAVLRDQIDKFSSTSEALLVRMEQCELSGDERAQEAQTFSESCDLVLESVKKIRNAILMNRNPEDVDSDNEYEDDGLTHADQKSTGPGTCTRPLSKPSMQISDVDNQQRLMRRLPEEDKKKIQEQIDVFKITKTKFEREVEKWDETGNDIIVLAKHMCMIMMDMTDFTRGRGRLKSTMDVIRSAQEISTAGQKLSVLARQIGEEAEETNGRNEQLRTTRKDLDSYLDKMTLFCQQLNICSRVKADVTQVGDELVVSGLDSAMSLIQAARNLLSAVVSTVKNAYIISTKFRSQTSTSRVEWKMTRPKKQPLVSGTPRGGGGHGIVRRASEKRTMPMQTLQEFHR